MKTNTPAIVLALIPSSTDASKNHEIRMGSDDRVYCNCPSWRFSKGEQKTCKHIKQFRASKN